MEIKDVIHFYIGQYALHGKQRVYISGVNTTTGYISNVAGDETIRIGEIKLILRKLSDMTEEEKQQIISVLGQPYTSYIEDVEWLMPHADGRERMAPLAIYAVLPTLLKMGFDLFGLCDAGLAIDNKSL